MIKSKEDLRYFIDEDQKRHSSPLSFRDIIFHTEKYVITKQLKTLRKLEYYTNNKERNVLYKLLFFLTRIRYNRMKNRTHLFIPPNVFGPGLYVPHTGSIHVSSIAKVGKNCCIRPGVLIVSNLGNSNNKLKQIIIGDNVEFSEGCKILCKKIGNNVIVGPNAVVLKSVPDNTTVYVNNVLYMSHSEI